MEYHILDNDYYKFTMQSRLYYLKHVAGFNIMPEKVEYQFVNRGEHCFNFTEDQLDAEIKNLLATPTINKQEVDFLKSTSLNHEYVDWFAGLEKPYEGAHIDYNMYDDGQLRLSIVGKWLDCILLEVPIMALISELNNITIKLPRSNDRFEKLYTTVKVQAKKDLMEFGTRRRITAAYQRYMFNFFINREKSYSDRMKTSNVLLSMQNNLQPVGTIAHEWFLANYAMSDIAHSTKRSILSWSDKISLGDYTAYLTDTFTSPVFFKSLGADLLNVRRVRQDSGDPCKFVEDYTMALTNAAYQNGTLKKLDFSNYTIIFSDSLNQEKIENIINHMTKINLGFDYKFGVGTYLSNNAETPLNIVIKPFKFDYTPVCKLSDVEGKITGSNGRTVQSEVNKFLGKRDY